MGRAIIRTTAFVLIATAPKTTTYTVSSTTYYHQNPWYRRVLYEGEEAGVPTAAPVSFETDELHPGAEIVEFQGTTYYYHEAAFYKEASGGGYIVVEAPVGAEVSSIPENAVPDEESESGLFIFDNAYFTRDINDSGQQIYRVEPQPPAEELDQMPSDAATFVADGETFYYVNYSFYVEYEEDGKTYYQFDTVFFEEVEDESGVAFYEVIGSPDGAEAVEVESN